MTTQAVDSQDCPEQNGSPAAISKPTGSYLIPLKTTLELDTVDKVINIFITAVPIQKASTILNSVRTLLPKDDGIDLQHLRRFAKPALVPAHVRELFASAAQPSESLLGENEILLILAPTSVISQEYLERFLAELLELVTIVTIEAPLLTPTSQEQATGWTEKYWPTIYKKSNPFGPHPSIVARAEEEIRGDMDRWMELAREAAQASKATGAGEAVGVVIVERVDGVARPIAIAGDARWLDWPREEDGGGLGNATAHATMRAIAMVAGQLRRADLASGQAEAPPETTTAEDIFHERPVLPVEQSAIQDPANTDGYLCHGLEIYTTHEPCVMCSMAIVHSRFAKAVFGQRMPATGGLCADGELRHGLFWRKELNWTLLAWQWCCDDQRNDGDLGVSRELNA